MAQADMFLKLTNIKGEALDSKHKDEIEVLSWSFDASQQGSAHGGTGSRTGKVRSMIVLISVKMAVFAPIPSANVSTASTVKAGLRRSVEDGAGSGHPHQQRWRRRSGSDH